MNGNLPVKYTPSDKQTIPITSEPLAIQLLKEIRNFLSDPDVWISNFNHRPLPHHKAKQWTELTKRTNDLLKSYDS